MDFQEFNFDGLVGPTHNYSGLSFGNVASTFHKEKASNPQRAALQGLEKMWSLHQLGLGQAILPPHERPYVPELRALGFSGSDTDILTKAAKTAPEIFRSLSSASPMWTANAATVAPSVDTPDGKLHFTPANLNNKYHRSIESVLTGRILKAVFPDAKRFSHHAPLPSGPWLGDEGAANHTRLCKSYGTPGLHVFVYGKQAFRPGPVPKKFPARQTKESSQSIARLHGIEARSLFLQQAPSLIDAGVFHNDVASVGNEGVFFSHEDAFAEGKAAFLKLKKEYRRVSGDPLQLIVVPRKKVSVKDAVKSYLFNTQLVTLSNGKMALIAPSECQEIRAVARYLEQLETESDGVISQVTFFDLRESMSNGGGPACLRLRVVLSEAERSAMHPGVLLDQDLYTQLKSWIKKHYRDRLKPKEIYDPKLWEESRSALAELTGLLKLGNLYHFQDPR